MEQTHMPRCTDEVEIIPYDHVTIKQEEVESSDSVDMVASYHEDVDVKEEQNHEVEMDPSLAATMMSVVLKDDSNASSADVEELVVEPSLLQFKCFHDDDDDRQEEDELRSPTLIFMPEAHYSECYLDDGGSYEHAASESKRLKYALKKSRSSGGGVGGCGAGGRGAAVGGGGPGAGVATPAVVFRCPHCCLSLTSVDYLNRHLRRGCRFRDAPIKNAYRCAQCGAGFSNYGELFQHRRKAHAPNAAAPPPQQNPNHNHHHNLNNDSAVSAVAAACRCLQCGSGFGSYGELFQHVCRTTQQQQQRNGHHPSQEAEEAAATTSSSSSSKTGTASAAVRVSSSKHSRCCHHPSPRRDFPDQSSSSSSSAPPRPELIVSAASSSSAPSFPDVACDLSVRRRRLPPIASSSSSSRTGSSSPPVNGSSPRVRTPPDLVFSSSAAVNHFEPVVPDVAANSDLPDVAAFPASCGAPDIVSCSRPSAAPGSGRRPQPPPPQPPLSPRASSSDSQPPDLVAGAPSLGLKTTRNTSAAKTTTTTTAEVDDHQERRRRHVSLTSGGGGGGGGTRLVRVNCSAHKRRNSEAAPASKTATAGETQE